MTAVNRDSYVWGSLNPVFIWCLRTNLSVHIQGSFSCVSKVKSQSSSKWRDSLDPKTDELLLCVLDSQVSGSPGAWGKSQEAKEFPNWGKRRGVA